MKLLKNYFNLQKQIYKYFNYKEDWKVIPLDDCTSYYWQLHQEENGSGFVRFQENIPKPNEEWMYGNEIYTQRFLPKYVYRTKDYTMISVDTRTDGNKFLSIFNNSKEIK